ncbi:TPA_exp: Uncharacterized protein A8136_1432 [Trichophyton benhamiae CBS 112371]|uniref:Uncharacterized protein n=1 Tax=Arthroderma benhamiae (strain ATCC MYA-4681 / CBS 112371) TaxID=663331 RepID=D4AW86_ARTBC|nr:uncharacterized protein ARB_00451 [Trichophyton benhamiae CBS 112371]EFE32626.1 hypothetical protein ARB_00451 [Trichophyton benhamiae CBS 112371]DAA75710.1 TPA_exp: Uncharacterized protein A8136_1432 [Trichophyton benhamiae CBS 112371]
MEDTQQVASAAETQGTLERYVQQRHRYYQHLSAFAIRFEEDHTGAEQDLPNFKSLVRALGIDSVEECVLLASDRTPGWTIISKLREHLLGGLQQCLHPKFGRYLVIIHYSGHGTYKPEQGLWFHANPQSKPFFTLNTLTEAVSINSQQSDVSMGAVFIIDSCEIGSARLTVRVDDTFELLAAVPEQKTTFATSGRQNQKQTFTAKLANAAAIAQGKARSVDFAELLDSAYSLSSAKFPVHKLLSGSVSIRVKFSGLAHSSLPQPQPPASLPLSMKVPAKVLFSCHFLEDSASEATKKLRSWIELLDPEIGLQVTGVFQTESTVLILLAPYTVFCTMRTLLPGITLIAGKVFIPQSPASTIEDPVLTSTPRQPERVPV